MVYSTYFPPPPPPLPIVPLTPFGTASPRLPPQSIFIAAATLRLLMPTKHDLYDELVPTWLSMWTMIDHCADWDYIWLTMLGRARKHTRSFDWNTVAPQIFHAANRIVQVGSSSVNAQQPPLCFVERESINSVDSDSKFYLKF